MSAVCFNRWGVCWDFASPGFLFCWGVLGDVLDALAGLVADETAPGGCGSVD